MAKLTIDYRKLHNIENEIFQVVSKGKKIYHGPNTLMIVLVVLFVICYLVSLQPTGVICRVFSIFDPKVAGSLVVRLGPQAQSSTL